MTLPRTLDELRRLNLSDILGLNHEFPNSYDFKLRLAEYHEIMGLKFKYHRNNLQNITVHCYRVECKFLCCTRFNANQRKFIVDEFEEHTCQTMDAVPKASRRKTGTCYTTEQLAPTILHILNNSNKPGDGRAVKCYYQERFGQLHKLFVVT